MAAQNDGPQNDGTGLHPRSQVNFESVPMTTGQRRLELLICGAQFVWRASLNERDLATIVVSLALTSAR